jgi:hypothetical protein
MTPQASRKFTILDGMILVAALAGGFALRRAAEDSLAGHGSIAYGASVLFLYRMIEAGFPFLVTLTPAVLVMRLRRPRPRWRRLARQPGTAASCAAILPIIIASVGLWKFVQLVKHPESLLPNGPDGSVTFGISIMIPLSGRSSGRTEASSASGSWAPG